MFKSATVFLFFWLCILTSCSVGDEIAAKQQRYLKDVTGSTHVEDYIREDMWAQLFPNRYGMGSRPLPDNHITPSGDFYSFHAFLLAAAKFPKFCGVGTTGTRKRELAAFLANVSQETSGGSQYAPGGYFIWGLYKVSEKDSANNWYADTTNKRYQPVQGVAYLGRGPLQLRGSYNYGAFSEAYYGSKDTLLQHPELLLEDPVASFASAIWLWMTPQYPRPSCHSIMTGKWKPNSDDIAAGRKPGFGATVNVITGGTECGTATDKTEYRAQYYRYFCRIFNVAPGKNIECAGEKPFGN